VGRGLDVVAPLGEEDSVIFDLPSGARMIELVDEDTVHRSVPEESELNAGRVVANFNIARWRVGLRVPKRCVEISLELSPNQDDASGNRRKAEGAVGLVIAGSKRGV
jgi:hypothetical protein